MKKINEIFYSIQGEGFFTGTPAVFVRFSGCNLNCDFCDTQHQQGEVMTKEEIFTKIIQYPSKHLILTGGEPALFIDFDFVQFFKDAGYFIQIETNGTCRIPQNIDWVTCSPKENLLLQEANELKVVYTGQSLLEFENFSASYRYLQPCSMRNTEEVINYIKSNPRWKLSVQLHKLLNIL
jgi:organic radical activating enzyme